MGGGFAHFEDELAEGGGHDRRKRFNGQLKR